MDYLELLSKIPDVSVINSDVIGRIEKSIREAKNDALVKCLSDLLIEFQQHISTEKGRQLGEFKWNAYSSGYDDGIPKEILKSELFKLLIVYLESRGFRTLVKINGEVNDGGIWHSLVISWRP